MHTPVYFEEVLDALKIVPGKKYIDATVGMGGHTNGIIQKGGEVLGIDWDTTHVINLHKGVLAHGNFADIAQIAREHHFDHVAGVLFDLGISYAQIVKGAKGLSYQNLEEPLDMRMNPTSEITAAWLLQKESEDRLYEIFAHNSEEIHARELAKQIVTYRKQHKLEKVGDLLSMIDRVLGARDTRTYARVFQALRIEVNEEFENIKKGMDGALEILEKGGRLVIITFHSVEDRIVKRYMKEHEGTLKEITKIKKGNVPSFARSAQVRVLKKK